MAWLSSFKFGIPARDVALFELNPTALDYTPRKIGDFGRGLDGSGVQITLSRNRPLLRINGNYITPAEFNRLTALMQTDHVPLIFQPVDLTGANIFQSVEERVFPTSTTQIPVPANSFTRAAALQREYGGRGVIRLVSITGHVVDAGIWGTLFSENFNLLATGLLSAAGPWIVQGGNGTTIDAYVSDSAPEIIEGAKTMIVVTDGAGTTLVQAIWRLGGHLVEPGFVGEHHVATFKMQLPYAQTNAAAVVKANPITGTVAWKVTIDATSATTADFVITRGALEVYRASLTGPFDAHEVWVRSENRVAEGGNRFFVALDTVTVWDEAVYVGDIDEFEFSGSKDSTPGASGTLARFDVFNCYDGDGYDASTGLMNLSNPLTAPLSSLDPIFMTYKYDAVAVNLAQIPFRSEGGWVDFWRYNFQLEGM